MNTFLKPGSWFSFLDQDLSLVVWRRARDVETLQSSDEHPKCQNPSILCMESSCGPFAVGMLAAGP